MSSNFVPDALRTATLRLAIRHAALFALLSLATFAVVYLGLSANLERRVESELSEDVDELAGKLRGLGIAEQVAIFRGDLDAADEEREFRVYQRMDSRSPTTSNLAPWRGVEILPPAVRALAPGREAWRTVRAPRIETRARVLARRTAEGDLIEFGASLADNDDLLAIVQRTFLLGWIATLIPGLLLGWFMARRALSGVDRVTEAALRIGRSDLTRRVPIGNDGTEIENLARAFNEMLDRIHASVRELKDVTSYVAHDLKSPIARIRGLAESSAATAALEPSTAVGIVDECDRLAAMIDTVLEIASHDARVVPLVPAPVDLGRVARDLVELYHPAAEDRGIRLVHTLGDAPFLVRGDLGRARRVISNLLDNAIKYTPPGGTIEVSMSTMSDHALLSIADTGIGIAPEVAARVFERFFRGDASRSTVGHGLGLSLARALVRAYDGEITVRTSPGRGSVFTVEWPAWSRGQPDETVMQRSSSG